MCNLDVEFLIGYSGQISDIQVKHKNLAILNSPVFSGKIFELPYLVLGNLSEENIQIQPQSILILCDLESTTDHTVLINIPLKLIKANAVLFK